MGGISHDVEVAEFFDFRDGFWPVFDDNEGVVGVFKFLTDETADAPEAANDCVVTEVLNVFFQFFPPKEEKDFGFDQEFGEISHDVGDCDDAVEDEPHGEVFPNGA